jgi:proton glutamate symport protein
MSLGGRAGKGPIIPHDAKPHAAMLETPEIRMPTWLTLGGLLAGIALGVLLRGSAAEAWIGTVLGPVGTLWLNALQITIVPLVAALVVTGMMHMARAAQAGRMAALTLGTFAALLVTGSVMSALVTPALLRIFPVPAGVADGFAADLAGVEAGPVPVFADFVTSFIPTNIFAAASQTAMIPVVIFAATLALAATRLGPVQRDAIALFFASIANAMLVMIGWVLRIAPLGVFALGAKLGASTGLGAIATLGHYVLTVSAIGFVIFIGAYGLAAFRVRAGLGAFARAVLPAQAVALSTQSSLASLPPMLAAARRLNIAEDTADFVLPMAVTVFRATSPAMNLAVAIYTAHLMGVEITAGTLVAGVIVASLTTLGAPSLPGSISFVSSIGPIAIAMGVPVAPLAILVAVEMLPDIMRTIGNVTMNVAVTGAIDRYAPAKPVPDA